MAHMSVGYEGYVTGGGMLQGFVGLQLRVFRSLGLGFGGTKILSINNPYIIPKYLM